jgi:ABC-type phosphonate transport system ATPase subunit
MIEACGLVKRYGATLAVDRLSFVVRPGTVTGFLGPNGSGKSSPSWACHRPRATTVASSPYSATWDLPPADVADYLDRLRTLTAEHSLV